MLFGRIAGQLIVEAVPRRVRRGRTDEPQIFHIDRQRIAHRGPDRIRAIANGLEDFIVRQVDRVRVVPGEPHHDVCAAAAVDRIGLRRALQDVRPVRPDDVCREHDGRQNCAAQRKPSWACESAYIRAVGLPWRRDRSCGLLLRRDLQTAADHSRRAYFLR
jgi:hypothetical protein